MWMGPPKALDCPNPMSSISTMSTLGALDGALTSNRGGGVAFRASNTVLWGHWGSGIGSTWRAVGTARRGGVASWVLTGVVVRGVEIRATDVVRAKIIDDLIIAVS